MEAIESGDATINSTYDEIKAEKKKKKQKPSASDGEADEDDLSDALDDASGDPKQIFTPHSRDMSEHLADHIESSEYDNRLIERFKDGFGEGFRKGFGESVDLVLEKILEMLREGMSADEIENSDTFADLSFDAVGGKLGVITFHSLEDRIVKVHFRNLAKECICPPEQAVCTCGGSRRADLLTRKPVDPTPEEIKRNSPSRSARLRVVRKVRESI